MELLGLIFISIYIYYYKINIMKHYKFTLSDDHTISSATFSIDIQNQLANSDFENEWVKIGKDGVTGKSGYSWDGCSPKVKINHKWRGTWDGKLIDGKYQMYDASMVHDILYQHLGLHNIPRKTADKMFYELAKLNNFQFAMLYYFAVRLIGGVWHTTMTYLKQHGADIY